MSPKFYGSLWVVFAASAGVLWLANFFTLLTLVVFGFIAFGLVFAGMICVLPGTVSHPTAKKRERVVSREGTAYEEFREARPCVSELSLGVTSRIVELSGQLCHKSDGRRYSGVEPWVDILVGFSSFWRSH